MPKLSQLRWVFDENEETRMLAEGYDPMVIEYMANQLGAKMLADFHEKNVCLRQHYEAVSYYEFVAGVFPGLESLMVITTERRAGESGYQNMNLDDLMEYQAYRDDVCVAPATFINGRYSLSCCKDIHALVIDLDAVEADVLDVVISNGSIGGNIPLPTYIVNSGRGVHFYYVFKEPVPFYRKNREPLKAMYDRICYFTKKGIAAKTDKHALTQPFRLPGSQTKIGQTATAWLSGEKWSVAQLGRRLGVDVSGMDLVAKPLLPQREYHEARAKWLESAAGSGAIQPRKKREWRSPLEGNEGFYRSCLRRCYEETEEGHRYKSMFAMAAVGYKVRINKEKVEDDLADLLIHYNSIGKRMGHTELKKAMKGYCPKADRFSSARLEEYFGWKFRRSWKERKENGGEILSHDEQRELARFKRDMKMRREGRKWTDGNGRKPGTHTKEQVVKDWRAAHPDGKPRECIEATGLSKNTVYKWWDSTD